MKILTYLYQEPYLLTFVKANVGISVGICFLQETTNGLTKLKKMHSL